MSPAYTMDPAEEDEEVEEVIDYTFLGISVCQTVEERVQAKREKSKQTARRIVTGVFRLPSCCFSPQTLEDDDPRKRNYSNMLSNKKEGTEDYVKNKSSHTRGYPSYGSSSGGSGEIQPESLPPDLCSPNTAPVPANVASQMLLKLDWLKTRLLHRDDHLCSSPLLDDDASSLI